MPLYTDPFEAYPANSALNLLGQWGADSHFTISTDQASGGSQSVKFSGATSTFEAVVNLSDGNGGDSYFQGDCLIHATGGAVIGVFCRATKTSSTFSGTAGNSNYHVRMAVAGDTNQGIAVWKLVNGTATILGSKIGATAFTTDIWYRQTLTCKGTTISLQVQRLTDGQYLNSSGAWQSAQATCISVTDNSVSGPGKAGIRCGSAAGGLAVCYFDNAVYDVVGSGGGGGQGIYTIISSSGVLVSFQAVQQVNLGAPSNLRLGSGGLNANSVSLLWTSGSGGMEDGFVVQRKLASAADTTYAIVGTTGKNVVTFNDATVSSSTSYTYRVYAFLGTTNSGYSNTLTETTPAGGTVPAVPTLSPFTAVSSTEIDGVIADNSGGTASGFHVYLSTDNVTYTLQNPLWVGSTEFHLTGLVPSTLYYGRVSAFNAYGESALSLPAQMATTQAGSGGTLSAPTIQSALPASDTVVSIVWNEVVGAKYYKVRIGAHGSGIWSYTKVFPKNWTCGLFGSTTAFPITGSQIVDYQMCAGDDAGDGAFSATASVTTLATGTVISPTGRNPVTITAFPQWLADMQNALTTYAGNPGGGVHPLATTLQAYANTPLDAQTGDPESNRAYDGPAIMYAITGNAAYAASAWSIYTGIVDALYTNPVTGVTTTFWKPLHGGGNAARNTYALGFPIIVYDLLYPWLQANGHLPEIEQDLNYMCEFTVGQGPDVTSGTVQGQGPLYAQDIQQSTFFCLCLTDLLISTNYLGGTATSSGEGTVSVGGLTATATDYSTWRNVLNLQYSLWGNGGAGAVTGQGGGHWQSSDYGQNTTQFSIAGAAAVRSIIEWQTVNAGGVQAVEYFPEILDFACNQLPWTILYQCTDDLQNWYQWSDTETQHKAPTSMALRLPSLLMTLIGTNRGALTSQYLQQFVNETATLYGWGRSGAGLTPHSERFVWWAPYVTALDWRNIGPGYMYAPVQPMLAYHPKWKTGETPNASADSAWIFFRNNLDSEHRECDTGDIQGYLAGAFWATHPLGYNPIGYSWYARSKNCKLYAGLAGAMNDFRLSGSRGAYAKAVDAGPFRFAYIAGGCAGTFYMSGNVYGDKPYYNNGGPPTGLTAPSFVNEDTRSVVYLPAPDSSSGCFVVMDRENLINVRLQSVVKSGVTYTGSALYNSTSTSGGPTDAASIDKATSLALVQWWIGASYTQIGNSFTYSVGSVNSRLDLLTPSSPNIQILTANDPTTNLIYVYDTFTGTTNQRWTSVRVSPATQWPIDLTPQYSTFLTSWAGWTASGSYQSTLVNGTASLTTVAQGTLIQRASCNDAVVMFSVVQSARVLTSGYTFAFTQVSATADILCLDLSPSKTWSYTVNGGSSNPLTVTDCSTAPNYPSTVHPPASGLAAFQLSGADAKTIVLTGV